MEKQQVMLDDTSTTSLDDKWTENNLEEDFLLSGDQRVKKRKGKMLMARWGYKKRENCERVRESARERVCLWERERERERELDRKCLWERDRKYVWERERDLEKTCVWERERKWSCVLCRERIENCA